MEKKKSKHFVYILKCGDGTLYTGYTVDVSQRLRMHKHGKGAKYTRGRGPLELVYQISFATKREALREEKRVKKLMRKQKEALVNAWQERQHSQ